MRKKIAIDCSRLQDETYTGTHRFLIGFLGEVAKNKNYEFYFYFSQLPTKLTKHRFFKLGHIKIVKKRPYTQLGLLLELGKYDYFVFPWQTLPVFSIFSRCITVGIIHDLGFSTKTKFFTFLTFFISKKLFSVSQSTRSQIPRASFFIGEGVDSSIFKVLDTEEILKLDHKFSFDSKFILSIGRIEERKNIFNNLKAFKIVHKSYPNLKYLFVGKFVISEEKIYSFLDDIKLDRDTIVFKKFITDEELNYYLNKCELTVFTSLDEGFGLPVIESYRIRKPVILSKIQALAELGLSAKQFADQNDPEDIAQKILYYLKSMNKEMSHLDYEKILKYYTWENSASRFFEGLKS
jgi:glycosyltransferase involved in cell wall biosynthesis